VLSLKLATLQKLHLVKKKDQQDILTQAHSGSSFYQLDYVSHAELVHNVSAMVFDCSDRTVKQLCHFLIAFAL
jgi:hypothetical protein